MLLLTLLAGIVFAGLMAIRLDLLKPSPAPLPAPATRLANQESWMSIWQSDRKIGYSHRRLTAFKTGYRLTERTVLRINTMGLVQDLDLKTDADLNSDMSLSAFSATATSDRFSFAARGEVTGGMLHVTMKNSRLDIPMKRPLYLTGDIWAAATAVATSPGATVDIPVFDPVSLSNLTVSVIFLGSEDIRIGDGSLRSARKFTTTFSGAVETAWIDDDGSVLKEEGPLGITLRKDTRENALETETSSGSEDLTLAASIPAGRTLTDPGALTRLDLKVEGAPSALLLDGGRQSFSGGILRIVREPLPDPPSISPGTETGFLTPTPFIQSDHPEIVAAAKAAVASADRPLSKAKNLVRWVHDNLEKRPVLSVPNALDTLRERAGDCNEHAVLLAALARAAGIPARVEAGLVYMNGRFYYHAWDSLYLGEWITADALMNQLPADVTHIRLVRGVGGQQADILGAIGHIKLKIIGTSP